MACFPWFSRALGRFFLTAGLAVNLLCLFPLASRAGEMRVAVPSTGLAFSVAQVSVTGFASRQRLVTDASLAGLNGCLAYCEVVNRVWLALQPAFQAQEDEVDLRLVVLRSAAVDAMAFPDGTLVISENFIARCGLDEAQIAFVLAHEAAHVLVQHERQALTSMLALSPSRLARTPDDLYIEMEYSYFSMSESYAFISQQGEFEADEIGMQLAALAGFAPQLQLKFMEQRATQAPESSMYATHPPDSERLTRLRDQMPLALRLFQFGRE
jgi:Zn-dependent protease with chaperone function